MQEIHLAKGADRRIRAGHLWIFSNEIARIINGDDAPAGAAAQIFDSKGHYLGHGYYNRHSLIAGRLLSRQREPDEKELLERRILAALELRSRFYGPGDDGCRLIYSEGDFLPGLIVDSFGDYLVVQLLTAGMDLRRETIIEILQRHLEPTGIVLRNDSPFRQLEGLTQGIEIIGSPPPTPLELTLEDLRLAVDLEKGQKTGHFFDQSQNRRHFASLVNGYNVLDTFCYSGCWGLQALRGGARSVTFVDSSAPALDLARHNGQLNGFGEQLNFVQSDVVAYLKKATRAKERFDAVVLDPPAFAKTKKSRRKGLQGYLRLNREGIRCLHSGGLLVTSSCSYHAADDEFRAVVATAAAQLGRFARILHIGHQGPDHPIAAGLPEGAYLKCLFVQVD